MEQGGHVNAAGANRVPDAPVRAGLRHTSPAHLLELLLIHLFPLDTCERLALLTLLREVARHLHLVVDLAHQVLLALFERLRRVAQLANGIAGPASATTATRRLGHGCEEQGEVSGSEREAGAGQGSAAGALGPFFLLPKRFIYKICVRGCVSWLVWKSAASSRIRLRRCSGRQEPHTNSQPGRDGARGGAEDGRCLPCGPQLDFVLAEAGHATKFIEEAPRTGSSRHGRSRRARS